MRGIAKVLQAMGHNVSGSDVSRTGHSKANITKNIDAVIYSSALSLVGRRFSRGEQSAST